jgi:hypothetical protein
MLKNKSKGIDNAILTRIAKKKQMEQRTRT